MNHSLPIDSSTAPIQGAVRASLRQRRGRGLPVLRLILALPLLASAFIDLPARVTLAFTTGNGALTIALTAAAVAGVLVCGPYPRRLLIRVLPYLGFLVWIGLSLVWAPPSFWGIQNGIVYILFGSLVVISGVVSTRHPAELLELIGGCMKWVDCVALFIVLLNLAVRGLPTANGIWWVSPRSLALVGLMVMSWHLAGWYYGVKGSFVPACLWLGAIAASLSRTGMAVALMLLGITCLLQLKFRLNKAGWSLAFFSISLAIAAALVTYSSVFQERFFGGDAGIQVGSTTINLEGRREIWEVVIRSAQESPIVGQGLGSSQVVIEAAYPMIKEIGHPHNDYLRLWHDFGIVGVLLFSVATGSWFVLLLRSWYQVEALGKRSAQLELAGAMGLFGMSLAMVTDNAIVYACVVGPLGILVGAGLGAGDGQRDRLTTPKPFLGTR